MKKLALAAMIGMLSAGAFAAQGDILARFRVIDVDPRPVGTIPQWPA